MIRQASLVHAELYKIVSRTSGRVGLAVAGLVSVVSVLALHQASRVQGASVNEQPLADVMSFDGYTALAWSLMGRNFFVLPLILLMVTAQLLAGEWAERTLRSALVRPVARAEILAAKFGALAIYSALTLLLTAGLTAAAAGALFGITEPMGPVIAGFAASWICDLGLIALGLALSVSLRSVVGVVVGAALFLMGDMALRALLRLLDMMNVVDAERWIPFFPGNALDAWNGYQGDWSPEAFAGLAALIAVSLVIGLLVFQRSDVS